MKDNSYMNSADKENLLTFYREGIRTQSYSGKEGPYAEKILKEMKELDFDEAWIDKTGNVAGRVGNGDKIIHFDSHMDVVIAENDGWTAPPFEAEIIDGCVYGRGSVDMKGGLSASVYAAALAKRKGLLEGKTVYVTASVDEEYCDGINLQHFYRDADIRPNYCIICEPTSNAVTLGHIGKMQARIITHGVSAHGSTPYLGVNAVYEMAEIISRVEKLNDTLREREGGGTIVLSNISSVAASLNAVPTQCEIYLDRRVYPNESLAQVRQEMDELVKGKRAEWVLGVLEHTSWTGEPLVYRPANEAWKLDENSELAIACKKAYEKVFKKECRYEYMIGGTNAVTPVSMGVQTIVCGPGDTDQAHMVDEHCAVQELYDACMLYTQMIEEL